MAGQSGFNGAWLVTATDQDTPERSLATFGADGIVLTSPPPVFPPLGPSLEAVYTSAGHGTWEATGPDSAVGSFVILTADRHGNALMTVTVRARLKLGDGGQSWTGEGLRHFADAAGNTLTTQPAIVTGERIAAVAPDDAMPREAVAAARGG
jgi:hypothetical protein